MKTSERIVNVSRGPLIESHHHGHIVVINNLGNTLYRLGNPDYKTFARSTAKLLQSISVIESGAIDKYHLSSQEIAILCASHNGEPEHTATVKSILAKLELDSSLLQCGIQEPYGQEARINMRKNDQKPTSLHNTCSGKHAGMLALAKYLQNPLQNYMLPSHPVQQLMLDTICEMAEITKNQIDMGIDGCGVPVFGLKINQLAYAFARLGSQSGLSPSKTAACQRIIEAVIKHPFHLAGSNRFDTRLIEISKGRIIGKMGAEGIYAVTVPSAAIGIVVKVEDGSQRALYPAVVETLKQLDLLNELELTQLTSFHTPIVENRRGEKVGIIQPVFKLEKV